MLCAVSEDEWVIQLCDKLNVHISALFYPSVCVYVCVFFCTYAVSVK